MEPKSSLDFMESITIWVTWTIIRKLKFDHFLIFFNDTNVEVIGSHMLQNVEGNRGATMNG